jgi:hypothetical protein
MCFYFGIIPRACDLRYFKPYDQFPLKSLHFLIQQRLILREMGFFMASLIHRIEHTLALLHHIWYLDNKPHAYSSLMHGSS